MEEKKERNSYLFNESIIIAVFIFGCNIAMSFAFSFFVSLADYGENEIINLMYVFSGIKVLIVPVVGTWFCVHFVEKRNISIPKSLIIALCVSIVFFFVEAIISYVLTRIDIQIYVKAGSIFGIMIPVLKGFFTAFFINHLSCIHQNSEDFDK